MSLQKRLKVPGNATEPAFVTRPARVWYAGSRMWYKLMASATGTELRMAAKIVRIFREVPEKEADLVTLRWAAAHPPERVRTGESEPYLMIVNKRGERLVRWRAKDGSWHKA